MRRPSPALVVAFLALIIALGGTALAATGQLVNIVDPGSPSQKARVDSTGALRVGSASPSTAFFDTLTVNDGSTIIGPTKATLALSRLVVANPAGNPPIVVRIRQVDGNSSTCGGTGNVVGSYTVGDGATVTDAMPAPVVLKPFASGHVWCLKAEVGSSGALPSVSWSGYAMAGTPPADRQARRAH